MSLRDRARDVLYMAATLRGPSGCSATQIAAALTRLPAEHGHTGTATAISLLGAAAVAAEVTLPNYVYPPGEYAGFREEGPQ